MERTYDHWQPNRYKAISGLVVYQPVLEKALEPYVDKKYITKSFVLSENVIPYKPIEEDSWCGYTPDSFHGEVDYVCIRKNEEKEIVNIGCQISIGMHMVFKFDIYGKYTPECKTEVFRKLGVGIKVNLLSKYKDIPHRSWFQKLTERFT